MDKDKYPSWLIPIAALFAMVLGVNRISTPPASNEDTIEPAAASTTAKQVPTINPTPRPELDDALLFYPHDAFHLLRYFFDAENIDEDKDSKEGKEVRLEIAPKGDGVEIDEAPAPDDPREETSQTKSWNAVINGLTGPDAYQLDFMIVGVPDPEASRLSMETDWTLDMVQRGLEASLHHFVLDRFDLPWRLRVRGEHPQTDDDGPRHPEEEPGLMLFRCGKDHNHLLLVFLVGETPTAGVHKTALTRSIDQIAALGSLTTHSADPVADPLRPWRTAVENCKSGDPAKPCFKRLIPVLGPHFTGSMSSYLRAFRNWPSARFECVSGSATGISADPLDPTPGDEELDQYLLTRWSDGTRAEWLLRDLSHPPDQDPKVSFTVTQWPDVEKIRWLRNNIEAHFGSTLDDLAILTESNTSYGSSINRISFKKDLATSTTDPAASTTDRSVSEPLILPFPMHISRLRNSKADSSNSLLNTNTGSNSRPYLPLTIAEKEEEDLLPPFSPVESISNWRVLESVLATLRRERVRFVAIRATNVEDAIFLSREIERYCPDTTIFLLGSDDLLLNPDAISALRGTIVLTTYPLVAYNQEWTRLAGEPNRVVHFPAQGAEGTYNAILALLSKMHAAAGNSEEEELEIERMLDYRNPFDHQSICCPPLWETVIGKDAMWPVQYIPANGNEDANGGDSPRSRFSEDLATLGIADPTVNASRLSMGAVLDYLFVPPRGLFEDYHLTAVAPSKEPDIPNLKEIEGDEQIARTLAPSRGTSVAFWVLWALCVYFAAVLIRPQLWIMHDPTFDGTRLAVEVETKDWYLNLFALLLWLMSLLLCAVAFIPLATTHWAGLEPSMANWPPFLTACGATLLIAFTPALRLKEPPSVSLAYFILLVWPFLSFLVVTMPARALLNGAGAPDNTHKLLTFFRYANLGSGVSIFLPLVYLDAAAMFWTFSNLRRLMFSERIAVSLKPPYGESLGMETGDNFPGLGGAEESVNRTVRTPTHQYPRRNSSVAIVTTVAVVFGCGWYGLGAIRWKPWNATVEPRWFYPLFLVCTLLVGILLAWELMATHDLWRTLKNLLDRVSGEGFLKAFQDDKDEASLRPKFSISAVYSDLTVDRLALAELKGSGTLQSKVDEVLKSLRKFESIDPRDFKPKAEQRVDLTNSLRELTISALDEPRWEANESIERFLYYRVFDYSQRIAHAIRNLLVWTTGGLFFLLLSISSYPYPNNDALLRFGWLFMAAAIFTSTSVLIGMNRERVLSNFAGGTPGKIDWNSSFVFHIAILALLPLLGAIGIQFPAAFQSTTGMIASLFNSTPHQ